MSHARTRRSHRLRAAVSYFLILVVALSLMGCGGSSSEPPAPHGVATAGAGPATWVLQGILNGIGSYTGNKAMGWILSIVGTGGDSSQELQNAINDMQNKLNTILADLTAIENQLNEIAKEIDVDMKQIESNQQSLAMKQAEDRINNEYLNLQAMDASLIGTDTGRQRAADMADDIISTSRTNIDLCVYEIYSGVMGYTAGLQGGALNAMTDAIIAADTDWKDGNTLLRYQTLETYFKQLVQMQLKGAAMMVDALHHRDDPWPSSQGVQRGIKPTDYPGTAAQWMNEKFLPMLADEVEEFLRCADRIILADCDLRTDITTTSPTVDMLPKDAETAWARADFMAAQLSPKRHPFGLVIRLVGEPDEVQGIADASYYYPEANAYTGSHSMSLVQLGVFPDKVRLNPVEKWNEWPSGYDQEYIQWNWGSHSWSDGHRAGTVAGHIVFNAASSIAVTKWAYPDQVSDSVWITTKFPNEAATIGNHDNPGIQMRHYDEDMNVVDNWTSDNHWWGHGTLVIRHRPEPWYQYRQYASQTGSGRDAVYDMTCDAYLGYAQNGPTPNVWCRVMSELNKHYWGVDLAFHIESGIAVPIINGMSTQRKMTVNGNLESGAYNTLYDSVQDNDTARLTAFWTMNSGEYDWWGVKNGNHSYPDTGAHHFFNPGEANPYHILNYVYMNGSGSHHNGYGCLADPQRLLLFF